jgi:hypothetical protein
VAGALDCETNSYRLLLLETDSSGPEDCPAGAARFAHMVAPPMNMPLQRQKGDVATAVVPVCFRCSADPAAPSPWHTGSYAAAAAVVHGRMYNNAGWATLEFL